MMWPCENACSHVSTNKTHTKGRMLLVVNHATKSRFSTSYIVFCTSEKSAAVFHKMKISSSSGNVEL